MRVTAEDIKVISRLVDDLCGIVLDETKAYLIESRLSNVAERAGCQTFSELYYKVRYDKDPALQNAIIDAITTNETLFFRDTSPFESLRHKVLPEMLDAKAATAFPKRIRIWSAGCSTGQEPYSIAIMLHEMIPDVSSWDIIITATDISDSAISQASSGCYGDIEVQRGMSSEFLTRYFAYDGQRWKVKDRLRAMVAFRRSNLHKPFGGLGPFDLIFCRNVAIYFRPESRRDLFMRLTNVLTPDGCLFVGSAESLTDLGPQFAPHRHCHAVFYRPRQPVPVTA